jgi:purine-binding chemotaxis protein CheW
MPKKRKKEWASRDIMDPDATEKRRALYEDDFYGRVEPKEEILQFIVFRVAREWYGVEITKIKEVMKVGRITYLPSSPGHIAGIVNFRGNILSVTDLKAIFSLPCEELSDKARIIVVESKPLQKGRWVDEVVESVEVPVRKIEVTLPTVPAGGAAYMKGQCALDDELVALIAVEKIFEKGYSSGLSGE